MLFDNESTDFGTLCHLKSTHINRKMLSDFQYETTLHKRLNNKCRLPYASNNEQNDKCKNI